MDYFSERVHREITYLSLCTTLRNGHLTSNTESVAKLRLARAKLPKNLRERSRLNTSLEELVQLRRSGSERNQRLSVLKGIGGSLEVHRDQSLYNVLQLNDLRLREATDLGQLADGAVCHGLDGVESRIVEFLDVTGGHAMFLEEVQRLVGHSDLEVNKIREIMGNATSCVRFIDRRI